MLLQSLLEDRRIETAVLGYLGEQGDRRVELEIIRVAKNVADGAILDGVDKSRTFFQTPTEDRMLQVRRSLPQVRNGEPLSGWARTKACHLGEDKPHPMRMLLASDELGSSHVKGGLLSIDEALQVMCVSAGFQVASSETLDALHLAKKACSNRLLKEVTPRPFNSWPSERAYRPASHVWLHRKMTSDIELEIEQRRTCHPHN